VFRRLSGISDAGLKHLANLANLQELDLRDTKVSAPAVADLQKSPPKFKVLAK
jgi:hypothetical protein